MKKKIHQTIFLVLFGAIVMIGSGAYKIGTASRMGPGYFPLMLGGLLVLLGLINLAGVAAEFAKHRGEAVQAEAAASASNYRAQLFIVAGIVAFIVFNIYGGFVLATLVSTWLVAKADPDTTGKQTMVLSIIILLFAVIVLNFGMKLQLPLFRWP